MRTSLKAAAFVAALALTVVVAAAPKKAPIDPVAKKPVKVTEKTPKIIVNFDPVYFLTEANRALFVKAPEKYLRKLQQQCPVRGLKGTPKKSNRLVVNGGLYYFCCTACPNEFLKNPGDYSAPLKDPVTGEKFSLTADGPRLKVGDAYWYFSTEESMAKFKADPAKYSKGLAK